MRGRRACVVPLLTRVLTLALAAAPGAAGAAPIEIMVEDAAAPWSAADGSGYANDVVRAAFAAVHQELRLTVVPYARCKRLVLQARVAGCFSMSPAPEQAGVVELADTPLFQVWPRFFVNRASGLRLLSFDDFGPGLRVGLVRHYEYPAAVQALARRGVQFAYAGSEVESLKQLAAGRIDAALVMTDAIKTEHVMLAQARVEDLAPALALPSMGAFLGLSARHADGALARRLFNEGMRRIDANGVRRAIGHKWGLD